MKQTEKKVEKCKHDWKPVTAKRRVDYDPAYWEILEFCNKCKKYKTKYE